MSDSLVLKGVKDVSHHTGTEMRRLNPRGGGDTFQLKRWWIVGGKNTVYTDATVFDVTTSVGTVKLALATNMSTNIKIIHDGNFVFTFGDNSTEVNQIGLFTDTFELIEYYVIPAQAGNPVITVDPPGSASRPVAPVPLSFTSTSAISGTAQVGETIQITAAEYVGGVGEITTNLLLQTSANGTSGWAFLQGNPGTAPGSVVSYVIPQAQEDQYLRASYQVTDDDGLNTNNSSATAQIIAGPTTIGTVNVTGDATPADGTTEAYSAAITGDAGGLTYAWSVDASGTVSGSATGATVNIDWSGTTQSAVSCQVTSSDSGVTDSPKSGALSVTPA